MLEIFSYSVTFIIFISFCIFKQEGKEIKIRSEDLSIEISKDGERLYVTVLFWKLGRFDRDTMSWIEFESPIFVEYDEDLFIPEKKQIEKITGGIYPKVSAFPLWVEQEGQDEIKI